MDSEIVDVVTDWESESYTGGYDGLRDLADGEFTGAVTEGSAWLFFLNGRVVGAFDGGVDAFEAADGTAFGAPDPSLPLLFTMLATGGETKAQYYTEDTSLSSADDTLSAGSFTGYVELSENVFSGDYYVVYYGGRKLPCAFVGQGRDLLTGDEAFSRAADETGIYEVMDVDVEVTELPEPDEPAEPESDPDPDAGSSGTAEPAEPSTATTATTETAEPTATETTETTDDTPDGTAAATAQPPEGDDGTTESPTDGGATAAPSAPAPEAGAGTADPAGGAGATASESGTTASESTPSGPEPATDPTTTEPTTRTAAEREWQETRTIPSLDPTESSTDGEPSGDTTETESRSESTSGGGTDARTSGRTVGAPADGGTRGQSADAGTQTDSRARGGEQSRGRSQAGGGSRSDEQTAALRERVAELESERDDARDRLQERESELEETEATVSQLREDNERLESRVAELESELEETRERLREFEAQRPDGDTEVTPSAALSGTNLFVRYDSKSDPTLETAHAETATRAQVEENLRVEVHTDFESEDAVVDGETYDEFLAGTVEYNFVGWVIRELLYELQETGAEGKLRDLYDAIPKVDRAELHGVVELVGDDQKVEGERPFDVILRDRMGDPLVVANVTDAREATAEPEVTELISDAREVAESRDSLGCAAYVSASFFEPRALEAVTSETGGGLLSRNKRASYVKLARKQGFHLGLVESREEGFHFTVPEL